MPVASVSLKEDVIPLKTTPSNSAVLLLGFTRLAKFASHNLFNMPLVLVAPNENSPNQTAGRESIGGHCNGFEHLAKNGAEHTLRQ